MPSKLRYRVPIPDGMRQRDHLIMLLHVAAGIEHDLMVQYLYAAYSLGGSQAEKYPDLLRSWRDTLITVAQEEMGHLLTVQNLLLLVGGPVSFERHHYGWSFNFQPFKFRLERFSYESLRLYLGAEKAESTDPFLKGLPPERVTNFAPVGAVYATLIDLVEDIPDATFDPATYPYQATFDEFARGHGPRNAKPYQYEPVLEPASPGRVPANIMVTPMATRTQALGALRGIAAQGEGEGKTEVSHSDRFEEMVSQFIAIRSDLDEPDSWSPSRPVCENPYVWETPWVEAKTEALLRQVVYDRNSTGGAPLLGPPGRTPIASETARKWAALFNFRYRMLLSLLTYLFRAPRSGPAGGSRRAQILSRVFGEMYNMKAIAGILVQLRIDDKPDSEFAGPPFQLPYTLGQSLSTASFWRMHLELLDSAVTLARDLLTNHVSQTPMDGNRYLALMCETDLECGRWIEKIFEGREWPA